MDRYKIIECWVKNTFKRTVNRLIKKGYIQVETIDFGFNKTDYIMVDNVRKNFIQYEHGDDATAVVDALIDVPLDYKLNSCLKNHNIPELLKDKYKNLNLVIFKDNWAGLDTTHIINDSNGYEHKVINIFEVDDVVCDITIEIVGGEGIPTPRKRNVTRTVLVVEDFDMIDLSDLYFDVVKDPLSCVYDNYIRDNKVRWGI